MYMYMHFGVAHRIEMVQSRGLESLALCGNPLRPRLGAGGVAARSIKLHTPSSWIFWGA